ncbi:MAG: hypothetical protein IPH89_08620 [Bacteroidetes bacterium]|nr:hypothetical protein [Bacteroidota bacterium]
MLQEDISKTSENFERYKERISNFSGEFELGLFLFIARKSIIWILLFFVLAFAGSYVYLRYTPPTYESHSIIQIQTSNQANKVLNVENIYENRNELPEAIELLRSKVFLKRVISKLPLDISYYNEGTFKANELYKSAPYAVEVKIKNESIIGKKIYINFDNGIDGYIEIVNNENKIKFVFKSNKWINTPEFDFKISVLNFPEIQKQNSQVKQNLYYFTINSNDAVVNDCSQKLEVKLLSEGAKTILISYTDFNALKTSDIINAITDEYTNFDVERKSESSKSIINFIDVQLDVVYNRLKESESSIQDFKKDNNVNENKDIATSNASRLNDLDDQIISLELEESVLSKIEREITKTKNIDTYNLQRY